MAFIGRALRSSPYLLNFTVVSVGTLVPVLIYANMRSPTQEQVEDTLVRGLGALLRESGGRVVGQLQSGRSSRIRD
jgi:hypothetical protein